MCLTTLYHPVCEFDDPLPYFPAAKKPVPVTSEMELSVMKNKVAELKAQMNQYSSRDRDRERASSASGEGFNIVNEITGSE